MKTHVPFLCLAHLTWVAVPVFAEEQAPERVEQVGDARWTSSLGLTSEAEPREEPPPESGAVLLDAPAAGTPEATIDPASPLSSWPYDHFDLIVGATRLRPTNYGEEDERLDEFAATMGMGLGWRFPIVSAVGVTLDFDLRISPAVNFDDLVTITFMRGAAALGPYFTLVDGEVVNWIVGGSGYAGMGVATMTDDTTGISPLFGARLYSTLTLGAISVTPSYRWLHPGVDVHYLGGQLAVRTSPRFGLFAGIEQRVKNAGSTDTDVDLVEAFVRTAPVKTEISLGVNFWF